jgi:hypothetical protein
MRNPFRTSCETCPTSDMPTWDQLEKRNDSIRWQRTSRIVAALAFVLLMFIVQKAESCEHNEAQDCRDELFRIRTNEAIKGGAK